MRTTIEKAEALMNAAINAAKALDKVLGTRQVSNRVKGIELHGRADGESAYADQSENCEPIVAVGNWNNLQAWSGVTQSRVEISDIPCRLGRALEKLGVPCEWSDQWTTCSGCGRLVRTSPDSHSYEPRYTEADGEINCVECTDAPSHLESLHGQTEDQVPSWIDPTDHGYVLSENDDLDCVPELQRKGITEYVTRREDRWTLSVWLTQEAFDAMQVSAWEGTTKADLLALMAELNACGPATEWVREQHTTDAHTIVLDCTRADWISWLVEAIGDMPENAPEWLRAVYARDAECNS